MPSISAFFGMVIYMYFNDHAPPHFHVEFSDGTRCSVAIETSEIIAGVVRPMRRLDEPLSWAAAHRDLLRLLWKELTR